MKDTDTIAPIVDQIKRFRESISARGFSSRVFGWDAEGCHSMVVEVAHFDRGRVGSRAIRVDSCVNFAGRKELEFEVRKLWELERLWRLVETLVLRRKLEGR